MVLLLFSNQTNIRKKSLKVFIFVLMKRSFADILQGLDSDRAAKLARKLPEWAAVGAEIPTALSLEQCSSSATASYKASVATWGEPVIAVDTHVFRVARRLGLSRGTTPRAVELDLERHTPPELRPIAHHWLILHGRYVCTALKPHCSDCPLTAWCKYFSEQ